MSEINNIDYLMWSNSKAKQLAAKVDTDNVKGLNGIEIFNFAKTAIQSNITHSEVNELLGISISTPKAIRKSGLINTEKSVNTGFEKAIDFYNTQMTSFQKYQVTSNTYDNLYQRLYNMERAIDQAFIDCEAYSDINIVPRWHYRYYPNINDKLLNFDIAEIRTRTTNDMNSLHELKDKIALIIEDANGIEEHTGPSKTEYDVDKLAQKYFGMSYEEFDAKYHDELEFCKTVTYADLNSMNETQRYVYAQAKAYAKEMIEITINEAHTTNWDAGEKKLNETIKATGDMMTISDFEYDGITEEGLNKIQSGIMYKAFEEALTDKYNELDRTGIENVEVNPTQKKPIKRNVNGQILIFNPDGSVYDATGKRIK